jgi:hypothetical protein
MTTENELKLKKVLAYQRARKIISTKQYKKELEYIKKIQDERTKRKGV